MLGQCRDGWSPSWEVGQQGGEELRSLTCSGLGNIGMVDLLGRGAPGWRWTPGF